MDHMELPHRHGNNEELSRLEHCMQEAESFQAVAGLCRLLSDAGRVRIFWLLCHCEECVVNLAAMVGMSSPAASHHLRQLKHSGLIISRRIGKEVYYRAADTAVAGLLLCYYLTGIGGYASLTPLRLVLFQLLWLLPGLLLAGQVKYF